MSPTKTALNNYVSRALERTEFGEFSQEFDPEWRSPCELRQEAEQTFWTPTEQQLSVDFSGLANAAEAPIHKDIQDYYGLYWSGILLAKTQEGPVSLIQIWNQEDFDRLIENLVGHLMMKIRAKAPFTVFFANTEEDSELFLSIDNASGVVLLEEPGKAPIREVAPNIASFLDRLTPDERLAAIY